MHKLSFIKHFNDKNQALMMVNKLMLEHYFTDIKVKKGKEHWTVECSGDNKAIKIFTIEEEKLASIEHSLNKVFSHRNDIIIEKEYSRFGTSFYIKTNNKIRISAIGYQFRENRIWFDLYTTAFPKEVLETLHQKIQFNFRSFLDPSKTHEGFYFDLKNVDEIIYIFEKLKPSILV